MFIRFFDGWVVNRETNLMRYINIWLSDSYCSITVANHRLSRLIRFVSRFITHLCIIFCKHILFKILFDVMWCIILRRSRLLTLTYTLACSCPSIWVVVFDILNLLVKVQKKLIIFLARMISYLKSYGHELVLQKA